MESTEYPTAAFAGIEFNLTILFLSLLTVFIVFILVFWASRHMKIKPSGKQNVLEWFYEFVTGIAEQNLGAYTKHYSLLLFTFFTFLLVANNLGLAAKIESGNYNLWTSPTANLVYDFGLSLMVSLYCQFEGIRLHGFKGYLKGFLEPMPAMLPMNILEEFTNLLSLALRLFGNIYAGEILINLLVGLSHASGLAFIPAFFLNLLWTAFSVFISGLQAYVFVLLTSMYLGKKVLGHGE